MSCLSPSLRSPACQRRIAGLVIPGRAPISAILQRIIDDSGIPQIQANATTAVV
jgi:hypothetical protein